MTDELKFLISTACRRVQYFFNYYASWQKLKKSKQNNSYQLSSMSKVCNENTRIDTNDCHVLPNGVVNSCSCRCTCAGRHCLSFFCDYASTTTTDPVSLFCLIVSLMK